MPNCSRITGFNVDEGSSAWMVTIRTPLPPVMVDFRPIFRNTFPGTTVIKTSAKKSLLETEWETAFEIPKEGVSMDVLGAFLRLIKWTVTIQDNADDSHALYLHNLPHPTDDPYNADWQRTRIGKLVRQAKSYSPSSGSKPAASDLSKKAAFWIGKHPRYQRADIVVAAPPGNPEKSFDLPQFIAAHLCSTFDLKLARCERTASGVPQKSIEQEPETLHANQAGKFKISTSLRRSSVIAIDDLYQSGATMNELVRACRAAGATSVMALAASKTARFCNGFTPSDWFDVSMEAEALEVSSGE